ncbi:hypothetical protein GGR02_003383 [Anoxybacillus voinovskiensis]|uniref:Integrase catalytic domain-containing protein n=1 Tax=Anoxybacteroides voinovskiense TaxID=230470 RepID=A0A840DR40_9BACL|nr:hypothetical protein [Anoxybacillus voinovskiensis]
MGITLIHTQPYDPQSKGKIERFFRTVQTRFYPLLELDPPKSFEELNERFGRWLEEEYHRKPHASLAGKTPHEVFQPQVERVAWIEDHYDERDVYVYEDGKQVAEAIRVRLEDNAYVKRHRSPFATVSMKERDQDV